MAIEQKITSNLWFDDKAEEAVNFYLSVFNDAKIKRTAYYTEEGQDIHGQTPGTIMTIEFQIEGQEFVALNGGPIFKFSEAISFIVNCETQQEVDYYWDKLREGGDPKAQVCGWLKDKFGVSWQVVPVVLNEMIVDADVNKSNRVVKAMMQMKKLDIDALQKAYDG